MPTRNLSLRVPEEQYNFLSSLAEEEHEDVSSTARGLMEMGRIMLAIEKYRCGDASLGKAARIAGVSVAKMMDILRDHGVPANLEQDDYLESLTAIGKLI